MRKKRKPKPLAPNRGFFNEYPMSQTLPEETFSLITKDLQLPEIKEEFSEEKALAVLTKAISQLMDRNLERLLQVCYRVDLAENKIEF